MSFLLGGPAQFSEEIRLGALFPIEEGADRILVGHHVLWKVRG